MSEKLPKEIIEKVIIEGDFELMWKLFKTISPDKRIYEKVKNGIKLKFPITWYLKGRYEEFPSAGKKGNMFDLLQRFEDDWSASRGRMERNGYSRGNRSFCMLYNRSI